MERKVEEKGRDWPEEESGAKGKGECKQILITAPLSCVRHPTRRTREQ